MREYLRGNDEDVLLLEHVADFSEDFEGSEVSLLEFLEEVVGAPRDGQDVLDDGDVVDVDHVGQLADQFFFDGLADQVLSDEEQLEVGEDRLGDLRV